ncbi:MAG: DUF3047 domain-containing protein [Rhodospirillaceae bacterium]|nr:DUF3047 domain-containing protein [Rhodospirillaceae bacterium]MBT4749726.1 DUF3047 domain-containing protein [Rhodospirillaceae bacterium]
MKPWAALILPMVLLGCTLPRAEVSPEGTLDIFGAGALSGDARLSAEWIIEGGGGEDQAKRLVSLQQAGVEASLTLKSGPESFVLARRTKAQLLATPFISWSWRMSAEHHAPGAIRLIVGFHGGNPKSRSWGAQPFVWLGTQLPPYDRVIAIQWGHRALERGNLYTDQKVPRYIARGGARQLGDWWPENLDLAEIYRKVWPKDDIEDAEIMFIGFAVIKTEGPSEGSFRKLSLYR